MEPTICLTFADDGKSAKAAEWQNSRFSFARLVDRLGSKMPSVGAIATTLALVSMPLGFGLSIDLYIAAGAMFLLAQLFFVRWLSITGMKSTKDLGLASNRQAMQYILLMKGLDEGLIAVSAYSLSASVTLAFVGIGSIVSGAILLAFATFGAATQATRLNRFWPSNTKS